MLEKIGVRHQDMTHLNVSEYIAEMDLKGLLCGWFFIGVMGNDYKTEYQNKVNWIYNITSQTLGTGKEFYWGIAPGASLKPGVSEPWWTILETEIFPQLSMNNVTHAYLYGWEHYGVKLPLTDPNYDNPLNLTPQEEADAFNRWVTLCDTHGFKAILLQPRQNPRIWPEMGSFTWLEYRPLREYGSGNNTKSSISTGMFDDWMVARNLARYLNTRAAIQNEFAKNYTRNCFYFCSEVALLRQNGVGWDRAVKEFTQGIYTCPHPNCIDHVFTSEEERDNHMKVNHCFLTVTLNDPSFPIQIASNSTYTFSITVRNSGNQPAIGVTTELLLKAFGGYPSGNPSVLTSLDSNLVNVGTLNPGEAVVASWRIQAPSTSTDIRSQYLIGKVTTSDGMYNDNYNDLWKCGKATVTAGEVITYPTTVGSVPSIAPVLVNGVQRVTPWVEHVEEGRNIIVAPPEVTVV